MRNDTGVNRVGLCALADSFGKASHLRRIDDNDGQPRGGERGAKRPTGPAFALLNVIKRKGIQAIL